MKYLGLVICLIGWGLYSCNDKDPTEVVVESNISIKIVTPSGSEINNFRGSPGNHVHFYITVTTTRGLSKLRAINYEDGVQESIQFYQVLTDPIINYASPQLTYYFVESQLDKKIEYMVEATDESGEVATYSLPVSVSR